jgi:hypothetical protein
MARGTKPSTHGKSRRFDCRRKDGIHAFIERLSGTGSLGCICVVIRRTTATGRRCPFGHRASTRSFDRRRTRPRLRNLCPARSSHSPHRYRTAGRSRGRRSSGDTDQRSKLQCTATSPIEHPRCDLDIMDDNHHRPVRTKFVSRRPAHGSQSAGSWAVSPRVV